jgi:hypothetical protein
MDVGEGGSRVEPTAHTVQVSVESGSSPSPRGYVT